MKNTDKFSVEIIARGSFVDEVPDIGGKRLYKVEAITVRLNSTALNEWILSECSNTRDCYTSQEEWIAHVTEYREKRLLWESKVEAALGVVDKGGTKITQAQAEVFTVVHIFKV